MKTVLAPILACAVATLADGADAPASAKKDAAIPPPGSLKVAVQQAPSLSASSAKTNAASTAPSAGSYTEHDTLLEFQKASAKRGFAQAQYIMALRYLSGNGVAKDENQARDLLAAAARQGHVKAREKLKTLKHAERKQ